MLEDTQQIDATDEVETDDIGSSTIDVRTEELVEVDLPKVSMRRIDMAAKPINVDERRVRMMISSETPVERSFGSEVLEHSAEAIDLEFLASGRAPLLNDHDMSQQIGVIESVELDSKTRSLWAVVRFGRTALAEEVWSLVSDGIRSNISIGYSIDKLVRQGDAYVAKRWKPVECSSVAIGADPSAQVRSSEPAKEPEIIIETNEEPKMSDLDIQAVRAEAAAEARKAATKDAAEIMSLGQRHNMTDFAREAVSAGTSIEQFRGEMLEKIGSTRALEDQNIGMTKKEVKSFSLMRAINALANPHDRKAQEAAAFEFECSRAAAEQYGRTAQGIMLPADVLRNWKRDLNSADEADLFGEDYRGDAFIDVLRNASSVMRAGATTLNGLSGDVRIPKKLTASTAAWIATEGGAAAESEMTVGNIAMTPKTLGAFTDITRQLMIQSSMDVERLVRDDLAQALALAIDLAALEGSGAAGQPTGVLNASGVTKVATFAGVNPTFAEVVGMESAVANNNALMGNLAYISRSNMIGAMKTTEKATGTAQFLTDGNTLNGYSLFSSNQGTDGNIYFGNWSDVLVGFFGGLDIVVDPYTASTSGTVRIVALQSTDVAVRHGESFAYGNDTV